MRDLVLLADMNSDEQLKAIEQINRNLVVMHEAVDRALHRIFVVGIVCGVLLSVILGKLAYVRDSSSR